MDLRKAVYDNMRGADSNTVSTTIDDAIQNGKESLLPGLGILFEVYWKHIPNEEKQRIVQVISSKLN